jgi:hypothetical protein
MSITIDVIVRAMTSSQVTETTTKPYPVQVAVRDLTVASRDCANMHWPGL